jgi:hypothetical protein
MYTGTPCDLCGGPTLLLEGGSIWCSAEDPHSGGHFVKRIAFERSPLKQGGAVAVAPRKIARPVAAAKPKPANPYAVGIDTFVDSDR